MATKNKKTVAVATGLCVSKGISLPGDLIADVETQYAAVQEWDWSKHIRRLLRADLSAVSPKKLTKKQGGYVANILLIFMSALVGCLILARVLWLGEFPARAVCLLVLLALVPVTYWLEYEKRARGVAVGVAVAVIAALAVWLTWREGHAVWLLAGGAIMAALVGWGTRENNSAADKRG